MKKIQLLMIISPLIAVAQVEPSVTFDPGTGNYLVRYMGHVGEDQTPAIIERIFEPTTKISPMIGVRVSRHGDSLLFTYDYTIRNGATSVQRLQDFDIEIGSSLSNTVSPGDSWHTGFYSIASVFGWYDSRGQDGVPDPLDGIAPDSLEKGFSFSSVGLPAIVNSYSRGKPAVILSFPDEPPSEIVDALRPLRAFPHNSVVRRTVGPRDPTYPFDTLVFVDTLLSYVTESHSLNWINSESIADKYTSYFILARTQLESNNVSEARLKLQQVLTDVGIDSSSTLTSEAYALLRYNTEYLLDHLPAGSPVSTYSLFATHSLWLEQNSDVHSGDIGANEAGSAPFLDSQVELSVGIGTSTASGFSIKANRIKVKQGATVRSDVYYNELENNGTITGTQHTPLTLPLVSILPEFKTATPGSQNITIPQNGTQTLSPGSYGDILVRRNGKLTLTGGVYHLGSLNTGDNVQILFQAPSEVRIAGRFDTDQGTSVGPEDTTSLSANQIVFYIGGINGSNGNLGATPKAAQIGLSNTVKANFYVPNGTLWIRQNSKATGAFIGKDVDVGIGVKIWHKSVF